VERFVARRVLSILPVVWGMATLVWVVMFVLPGDPARVILGPTADPQLIDEVRREWGLDLPRSHQYLFYLGRLGRLHLFRSYIQGRPVLDIVLEGAWPSAVLAVTAIGLALILGVAAGLAAARRPHGALDRVLLTLSLGGLAVPVFWLGLVLRMVFASWLQWLPVSSYTPGGAPAARLLGLAWLPLPHLPHLVLPAVTLSAFSAGYFARIVRAALLEALGEDFIRTARAKGLSPGRVLRRHALAHALLPLATVAGVQLATLMGGAIATEIIYAWPGLGSILLLAIQNRDLPVVSGCVIFLTLVFVVVNLVVDLGYAWLDPRVRSPS